MRKLRAWLLRLWGLPNQKLQDQEFAEEIAAHLQMHIEDNLRSGMDPGTQVYAARCREEWLHKIPHAGVHRRAQLLYQQLDGLQALRRTLRPELLAESRKHKAAKRLRQIPGIGPIRAARLLALMQTPHRFR